MDYLQSHSWEIQYYGLSIMGWVLPGQKVCYLTLKEGKRIHRNTRCFFYIDSAISKKQAIGDTHQMKAVGTSRGVCQCRQTHLESASWIKTTMHNMQRYPCRQNTDGFPNTCLLFILGWISLCSFSLPPDSLLSSSLVNMYWKCTKCQISIFSVRLKYNSGSQPEKRKVRNYRGIK